MGGMGGMYGDDEHDMHMRMMMQRQQQMQAMECDIARYCISTPHAHTLLNIELANCRLIVKTLIWKPQCRP